MPSKIRPDDWDRLFAPNAPRRGGPLRALGNLLLLVVLLGLIAGGATFVLRYREQQVASAAATTIAFQTNVAPGLTASAAPTATAAVQLTATRFTIQTATAAAALGTVVATPATPVAGLGVGVVTAGGNLRSEPRIAGETVVGLIWPGDQVAFIERREVDGQAWFHIQVLRPAPDRGGEGVPAGTEGWASATLLSPPTPVPAP
ncbi:MAG TPA: SH3 domain-containing protein [Roseiflexaceae bacterium]|nr:SH3 domain-containing protein [Roseiflexaceae bacterium]